MSLSHQKNVSSFGSLSGSIKYDRQVYHWFLLLITRPAVKAGLIQNEELRSAHQRIALNHWKERAGYLYALTVAVGAFYSRDYYLLLLIVPSLFLLKKIFSDNRDAVAKIGMALITRDFTQDKLFASTLYEISEHYARTLNIPSLVDMITAQDLILRFVVIYAYLFFLIVSPQDFLQLILCTLIVYFGVLFCLNNPFILSRLK